MSTNYTPGLCNIGPAEIKRRQQTGYIALVATLMLAGLLFGLRLPPLWRLTLFIPAAFTAIALLQAAMHFCVAYGFAGVFNVAFGAGKTDNVVEAQFRAADRKQALRIMAYSVLAAAVVTAVCYILPF